MTTPQRVTVRKVNGIRGDARKTVCYCGRAFAGWPASKYGNYRRLDCPDDFRHALEARADLEQHLAELWEECEHGTKPLGCYCINWDGIGETPACHAAVYAELLNARYVNAEAS